MQDLNTPKAIAKIHYIFGELEKIIQGKFENLKDVLKESSEKEKIKEIVSSSEFLQNFFGTSFFKDSSDFFGISSEFLSILKCLILILYLRDLSLINVQSKSILKP